MGVWVSVMFNATSSLFRLYRAMSVLLVDEYEYLEKTTDLSQVENNMYYVLKLYFQIR